jgi:protein-tyrosine phosphatase
MHRAAEPTPHVGVLVVCTGNICRSPAGERLLRHALPAAAIEVSSAGTHGVVGHPIEPSMARLLTADGVDASGFVARRLTERLVRGADLVLTMQTGHRSAVVQTHPQALGRTFTLREFAHLLDEGHRAQPAAYLQDLGTDPAARLRALVGLAADSRTRRLSTPCPEPDIDDPYQRGDEAYRRAYAAIRAAVDGIVGHLAGPRP